MRAAVITKAGDPEVLQVMEIEEPSAGPEDLLVEAKATALNRADLSQRRGGYPAPAGVRSEVPGLETAGVVLAVGERVRSFQAGDRVFGLLGGGGYAERVVLHERMAMPVPGNLSFIEAASIPEVFFTAYDALFTQCRLRMGERALIHAAGSGVGTAAIQLAHQAGAITFATASSAEKLSKAAALGLDVGIDYKEQDFARVIAERTNGRGVDVVLDVVGAPYWDRNLESLAMRGRMVLVGSLGGGRTEMNLGALMQKRLQVHGTVLRVRPLEEKITLTQEFLKRVLPLIEAGRIKAVVDRVFSLEDVAAAHAYMESNQNFGKIVLKLG